MFEQAFKNIDDILRKDAGVGSELDYVEQTSWVLFLKYLEDFEKGTRTEAKLGGKEYKDIIEPKYKWEAWAAPRTSDGKLDHNKALAGDDLIDFVERELLNHHPRVLCYDRSEEHTSELQSPDHLVCRLLLEK